MDSQAKQDRQEQQVPQEVLVTQVTLVNRVPQEVMDSLDLVVRLAFRVILVKMAALVSQVLLDKQVCLKQTHFRIKKSNIFSNRELLKTESRHDANFVVTGGTASCYIDNLRCHRWLSLLDSSIVAATDDKFGNSPFFINP